MKIMYGIWGSKACTLCQWAPLILIPQFPGIRLSFDHDSEHYYYPLLNAYCPQYYFTHHHSLFHKSVFLRPPPLQTFWVLYLATPNGINFCDFLYSSLLWQHSPLLVMPPKTSRQSFFPQLPWLLRTTFTSETQAKALSTLTDFTGKSIPTQSHPSLNTCTWTVSISPAHCPVYDNDWPTWSWSVKLLSTKMHVPIVGGSHHVFYRDCPTYKFESAGASLKFKLGFTLSEARQEARTWGFSLTTPVLSFALLII